MPYRLNDSGASRRPNSRVVAGGLQALLKLRNAPAHGFALGLVGVDDGVFVAFGHALLSVSGRRVLSDNTAPLCRQLSAGVHARGHSFSKWRKLAKPWLSANVFPRPENPERPVCVAA